MILNDYNPNGELINCLTCGRDTTAKGGCCYRCVGRGQQGLDERKDRPVIRFDGDPIMQVLGDFDNAYGENSMRPAKKRGRFLSSAEEIRHFNKMRKIYNT